MQNSRIDLYESVGLGLIICCDSSVIYSNQTGGSACLHPEIEGVFIPLRNDYTENEKRFIQHLRAHLKVHDEEIFERFGDVDVLHVNPYSGRIRGSGSEKVKLDIKMPDERSLKKIDFKFF